MVMEIIGKTIFGTKSGGNLVNLQDYFLEYEPGVEDKVGAVESEFWTIIESGTTQSYQNGGYRFTGGGDGANQTSEAETAINLPIGASAYCTVYGERTGTGSTTSTGVTYNLKFNNTSVAGRTIGRDTAPRGSLFMVTYLGGNDYLVVAEDSISTRTSVGGFKFRFRARGGFGASMILNVSPIKYIF